jgi:hypothetical protein
LEWYHVVNLLACSELILGPESRPWFRVSSRKYEDTPLSTEHTADTPSRFSAGPLLKRPDLDGRFEILYLSENRIVCLYEVEAVFGSTDTWMASNPNESYSDVPVQVSLQRVADLTLVSQQMRLATTAQELTGDWRGYRTRERGGSLRQPTGVAPTQSLGEALYNTEGIEAFRTLSAKVPNMLNLVVFPKKLLGGSLISYQDPKTGKVHRIPPAS